MNARVFNSSGKNIFLNEKASNRMSQRQGTSFAALIAGSQRVFSGKEYIEAAPMDRLTT
jgi:hypothetical protein